MFAINGIRDTISSVIQGVTQAVKSVIPLDLGGLMQSLGGQGSGADMAPASRSANTLLQRELDKLRQMS